MTWGAQVVHVAWKDVRQARWAFGAFVLLALVAAVGVGSMQPAMARSLGVLPILLWLLGYLATAVVIQHDSPVDSRANWRSAPLVSSAIFGAKILLLCAIVLGLPAALQLAALAEIGVSTSQYAAYLIDSIAPIAAFLPLCLLISVSTNDFKTFAFLLLVALGAHIALEALLPDSLSWMLPSNRARLGVQLIWSAVVLAFAAWRYSSAPRQRHVLLSAFILLDGLVGVVTPWSARWMADPSIAPAAHGEFQRVPLRFDEIRLSGGKDASQIDVSVAARLDSAHARVILSSISVDFADASHQPHEPYPFPSQPWGVKRLGVALTPVKHAAIDTAEVKIGWNQNLSNFATVAAHKLDTTAVANIKAIVNILDAHLLCRMPFAVGAKASSSGQYFEVVRAYNQQKRSFDVRSLAVRRTSSERHSYIFDDSLEFALVNRRSGEIIELATERFITAATPTVLPGPMMYEAVQHVSVIDPHSLKEAAWLDDADLVVAVWRPKYSYPVTFNGIKVRKGAQ